MTIKVPALKGQQTLFLQVMTISILKFTMLIQTNHSKPIIFGY